MSSLLASSVTEDGIISQDDFAKFLSSLCIKRSGVACDGSSVTFEELNINLQLQFILDVCSHRKDEEEVCIEHLQMMWREGDDFGFVVVSGEQQMLRQQVTDFCVDSYQYAVDMGFVEHGRSYIYVQARRYTVPCTKN